MSNTNTAPHYFLDLSGMARAFADNRGALVEVTQANGRAFRATIVGLAGEGYVRLDAGDTFEVRIADVDTFEIL